MGSFLALDADFYYRIVIIIKFNSISIFVFLIWKILKYLVLAGSSRGKIEEKEKNIEYFLEWRILVEKEVEK